MKLFDFGRMVQIVIIPPAKFILSEDEGLRALIQLLTGRIRQASLPPHNPLLPGKHRRLGAIGQVQFA